MLYDEIMTPDARDRAKAKKQSQAKRGRAQVPKTGPSSDDAHEVVYFRRHFEDDFEQRSPGREFLESCPAKVRATMKATLAAVAEAPPKRFSGGGYWEAMHGNLSGRYEVRVDGPGRKMHYRFFCLLDYEAEETAKPYLVVVDGDAKPFKTRFPQSVYDRAEELGDEYLRRQPRSLYSD